jgi:alpha-tubulin suppressor-like RCC1 family protein
MALKRDGSMWGWGHNGAGGLGTGDRVHYSTPVQVNAITTWSYVSAGTHTLALMADGSLWAWGNNSFGQLGNGSTGINEVPTNVQ